MIKQYHKIQVLEDDSGCSWLAEMSLILCNTVIQQMLPNSWCRIFSAHLPEGIDRPVTQIGLLRVECMY